MDCTGSKLVFELLSKSGKLLRLAPPLLQQYRLLGVGQAVLSSNAPDAPTQQLDDSMTAANYQQQSPDHKREQSKQELSPMVGYIA